VKKKKPISNSPYARKNGVMRLSRGENVLAKARRQGAREVVLKIAARNERGRKKRGQEGGSCSEGDRRNFWEQLKTLKKGENCNQKD